MGLNSSTGHSQPVPERFPPVSSYAILVLWTRSHSPLLQQLSLNITRELCSYLSFQKLVTILPKEVRFFDIGSNRWKLRWKLRQKVKIHEGYGCTFISEDKVFLCGGGSVVSTLLFHADDCAYILEGSGSVKTLQNMLVPHHWHGLLYSAGEVYVFGGRDSLYVTLRTCEKFNLSTSQWLPLPDMHKARCGFNPCWCASVIYLCGGKNKAVETFDPRSSVFTLLAELVLPEAECCTSIVTGDGELIVVSAHFICKMRKDGSFGVQKHMTYVPYSTCTPVLYGEIVFSVTLHSCYSINLTTGEVATESVGE